MAVYFLAHLNEILGVIQTNFIWSIGRRRSWVHKANRSLQRTNGFCFVVLICTAGFYCRQLDTLKWIFCLILLSPQSSAVFCQLLFATSSSFRRMESFLFRSFQSSSRPPESLSSSRLATYLLTARWKRRDSVTMILGSLFILCFPFQYLCNLWFLWLDILHHNWFL